MPLSQYEQARAHIRHCQKRLPEMFSATPIILLPAATGPAPEGLAWTGDASMNAPWTALGTPAISIPFPPPPRLRRTGPVDGLPLGLQIVANLGEDARVMRTAARLHEVLRC
jgi:Asp-tRNA(Asn)/Glu-tRNA(Gln) amidotransferase A subunit family amidase